MTAEFLASPKARAVIMEFWNSDDAGWENPEGIKTAKTALAAIHDVELVGQVAAMERDGNLYLINRTKIDENRVEQLIIQNIEADNERISTD